MVEGPPFVRIPFQTQRPIVVFLGLEAGKLGGTQHGVIDGRLVHRPDCRFVVLRSNQFANVRAFGTPHVGADMDEGKDVESGTTHGALFLIMPSFVRIGDIVCVGRVNEQPLTFEGGFGTTFSSSRI